MVIRGGCGQHAAPSGPRNSTMRSRWRCVAWAMAALAAPLSWGAAGWHPMTRAPDRPAARAQCTTPSSPHPRDSGSSLESGGSPVLASSSTGCGSRPWERHPGGVQLHRALARQHRRGAPRLRQPRQRPQGLCCTPCMHAAGSSLDAGSPCCAVGHRPWACAAVTLDPGQPRQLSRACSPSSQHRERGAQWMAAAAQATMDTSTTTTTHPPLECSMTTVATCAVGGSRRRAAAAARPPAAAPCSPASAAAEPPGQGTLPEPIKLLPLQKAPRTAACATPHGAWKAWASRTWTDAPTQPAPRVRMRRRCSRCMLISAARAAHPFPGLHLRHAVKLKHA